MKLIIIVLLILLALIASSISYLNGMHSFEEIAVRTIFFFLMPMHWIMAYIFGWTMYGGGAILEITDSKFWRRSSFFFAIGLYVAGLYFVFH